MTAAHSVMLMFVYGIAPRAAPEVADILAWAIVAGRGAAPGLGVIGFWVTGH